MGKKNLANLIRNAFLGKGGGKILKNGNQFKWSWLALKPFRKNFLTQKGPN